MYSKEGQKNGFNGRGMDMGCLKKEEQMFIQKQ